jgi:hypothetical protein
MYRYLTPEDREALFGHQFQQALTRVRHTPETRAQWLLDIGYRYDNIHHLTDSQVQTLRWEMTVFLHPVPHLGRGPVPSVTRDEVLRWVERIHNGVKRLTKGHRWRLEAATCYQFEVSQESGALEADSSLKVPLANQVGQVLMAVARRLRHCERKGCHHLFVARKRQRYCKPSCSEMTRTQRYRRKQRKAGRPQQTVVSGPETP